MADAKGCDTVLNLVYANPTPIEILLAKTDSISCPQYKDGKIYLEVQGGTPVVTQPYTYSIDGISYQNNSIFDSLANGTEHRREAIFAFLDHYLANLERRLQAPDFRGVMLPGVKSLLDALREENDAHLGLLTGNIRRGAAIKLSRHGIFDRFVDGGFGCDHHDRNQLGPIATQRMQAATGTTYDLADIIVIGDTPKDIRCAAAFGAKCLAVATGDYTVDELDALKPWRTVESFGDVPSTVDLLLRAE